MPADLDFDLAEAEEELRGCPGVPVSAAALGLPPCVATIAERHGFPLLKVVEPGGPGSAPRALARARAECARALAAEGYSIRRIAFVLNKDRQSVKAMLRRCSG